MTSFTCFWPSALTRFALSPAMESPLALKATTDGIVGRPHEAHLVWHGGPPTIRGRSVGIGMSRNQWKSHENPMKMEIPHENPWKIHENPWKSHENPWKIHGNPWKSHGKSHGKSMKIHQNPWKIHENPMLPCEHPMNQVDAGIFISPILGLCFNLAWWWDHHKSTICADGNSRIRCAHIQAHRRCLLEASRMAPKRMTSWHSTSRKISKPRDFRVSNACFMVFSNGPNTFGNAFHNVPQ